MRGLTNPKPDLRLSSLNTTGLFGIEQLTSASGFEELKSECLSKSAAYVNEATATPENGREAIQWQQPTKLLT